jgi:hypothetical protein
MPTPPSFNADNPMIPQSEDQADHEAQATRNHRLHLRLPRHFLFWLLWWCVLVNPLATAYRTMATMMLAEERKFSGMRRA